MEQKSSSNHNNKLLNCLIGGLIGDCIGGYYENNKHDFISPLSYTWECSDDTQLTLATLEAIIQNKLEVNPEKIAKNFLEWFNRGHLSGLGASTLGALQALQIGGHWALVGRTGEFAAGNGAAMRIAPLAFVLNTQFNRVLIRDVVNITHKHDEAYTAALAVLLVIESNYTSPKQTLEWIIQNISDSNTRDNFIKLTTLKPATCQEAAKLVGNSGYAASSIPLAIYASMRGLEKRDMKLVLKELCLAGGDTDATCSIAGQIMGALGDEYIIPTKLYKQATYLKEFSLIENLHSKFQKLKKAL